VAGVGSSLAMDTSALHRLISLSEVDQSLFKAGGLRRRIQLLYELDVYLGDNNEENALGARDPLYKRARALQGRMEALNSNIYLKLRDSILRGAHPAMLRRWLRLYGYEFSSPAPGLGYDDLDELMSGVLQLREPVNAAIHGPEMVFYQPTPARHIVDLIDVGGLSETDVLVDLGAGLGHVPILASMLTGCRAIGVELERAYVESARDCVGRLALKRVAFVQQDAREADLSAGSVFYLYTPFTGTTLNAVVAKLKKEAEKRVIRVCTLGPCAQVIAGQTWLTSSESPHADRITCFYSRAR